MKSIFKLLVLALALSACTGETKNSRLFVNESEKEVKILPYHYGFPYSDTIVLSPGASHTFSTGVSNGAEEEPADCSRNIDSAYTEVIGGGTLTKLLQDEDEWETESEQTKQIPREFEHTCRFIIRDSDIEE